MDNSFHRPQQFYLPYLLPTHHLKHSTPSFGVRRSIKQQSISTAGTESPLACDEFEFPNVPRSPRKRRLSRFGQA
ncbi:MAG: hypothetical protein KME19_08490 [Microcoleus vaginatus WJT46-NPBG5]|nr:hypothetical protein [Microcoleus vaginatus WJT46-NPBG5]